jgi:acyl-CoA dehydrogenase
MDFRFDTSERDIIDQAKRTFARHLPAGRLLKETGGDNGWRAVAEDGWLHGGLDPERGGVGLPLVMVAAIGREAGRVLAGDAFATNSVMLSALLAEHDDASSLLTHPGFVLADGRGETFVGDDEGAADWCFGVEPGMAAYRLTDDGRLFRYDPSSWTFAPLGGLGLATGRATIVSDAQPSAMWQVVEPDHELLWATEIVHAAGLVGLGEQALADTVEYALQREQFGSVIGRFQAVKHALADVAVQLEVAWNAVLFAALRRDRGAVSIAQMQAATAADEASRAMVQFFGGIAMTWEHHAHLYLKSAQLGRWRFGSVEDHALKLAHHLMTEEVPS